MDKAPEWTNRELRMAEYATELRDAGVDITTQDWTEAKMKKTLNLSLSGK